MSRRGRVLLIPAPLVNHAGQLRAFLPWGLLSLRAMAGPHHPEVEVWFPSETLGSTEGMKTSSDVAETIIDSLEDLDDIDAVGLSTMCSTFHHSVMLARRLKARRPDLSLWMGGPQASMVAGPLLAALPEVDAVFVGEAEATFGEVLERWVSHGATSCPPLQGIDGVMTRDRPWIPRAPIADLDQLPLVDLSAIELDILRRQHSDGAETIALPIEVSRGCPGRCAFCSTGLYWGRRVRRRSDERVIDEMRQRIDATGLHHFELLGDNFSAPLLRLRAFCHALIRRRAEMSPPPVWMCDSTLDRLCDEDLELLWAAGCRGFFVGVESASQETLDRLGKRVDLSRELEIIALAVERGFDIKASLIVGFPWETTEDVDRTFALHADLLRRGVKECQLWLLCPLPGTKLTAEHEVVFDRYASSLSMERGRLGSISDDEALRQMIQHSPDLFLQLGRFETPSLEPVELTATVETAFQINLIHARSRREVGTGAER